MWLPHPAYALRAFSPILRFLTIGLEHCPATAARRGHSTDRRAGCWCAPRRSARLPASRSPPRRSTGASLVSAWGQGLDGYRPESGQHRLASSPLGKETRRRSTFFLPWPWRSAGTPRQHGEEHHNKLLHPHISEGTAIMVQPKLGGERPPSSGSWGRTWKIPEKSAGPFMATITELIPSTVKACTMKGSGAG